MIAILPRRHADNFFEDLAEILGVGIAYHLADLLHGAILLLQVYLGFFDAQVCNIVDKMHPGLLQKESAEITGIHIDLFRDRRQRDILVEITVDVLDRLADGSAVTVPRHLTAIVL